jgi:hypothetical protein
MSINLYMNRECNRKLNPSPRYLRAGCRAIIPVPYPFLRIIVNHPGHFYQTHEPKHQSTAISHKKVSTPYLNALSNHDNWRMDAVPGYHNMKSDTGNLRPEPEPEPVPELSGPGYWNAGTGSTTLNLNAK